MQLTFRPVKRHWITKGRDPFIVDGIRKKRGSLEGQRGITGDSSQDSNISELCARYSQLRLIFLVLDCLDFNARFLSPAARYP
jgi:hypothetical protein